MEENINSPSSLHNIESNSCSPVLNQSPTSSLSSIKKEKEEPQTKSHFLHQILDIKPNSEELKQKNEFTQNNENVLPLYQNPLNLFKTQNFFKPFSFQYNPHSNNMFGLQQDHNSILFKNNTYIECVVCHDKSSGKHYGQYTCEGCKSFFKRSVRRNLTYQCRSSKNCPIDQYHRNQCQHCRFKKCLKMGMKKEAVQQGRNPNSNSNTNKNSISKKTPNTTETEPEQQKINFSLIPKLVYNQNSLNGQENLLEFSNKFFNKIHDLNSTIPFFNFINQSDLIELLKLNWSELLFINICQLNISLDFEIDFNNELDEDKCLSNFKQLAFKLKNLNLDSDEYNYLKGLILYNSDNGELVDKDTIENFQNLCHSYLKDLLSLKDKDKYLKFGKILLILNSYSKTMYHIKKYLLNNQTENDISLSIENSVKLKTNPNPEQSILKFSPIFNSYLPFNYSNFLFNFRYPFFKNSPNTSSSSYSNS